MTLVAHVVSSTGIGGIVAYLVLGAVALVAAYRLDSIRNESGRGLWRLAVERFSYAGHGGSGVATRRSSMVLMLFVTLVVVAVAAVGLAWLGSREDGTAVTEAAPAADADAVAAGGTTTGEPAAAPLTPGSEEAAIAAAVEVSREAFPEGAENVVITKAGASVDALAAGGMQGLLDGPLLLTGSDGLSTETAAEIERLGMPAIHLLGGTAAVSSQVEFQLIAAGHDMHRHAGANGVLTAIDIASRHFPDATGAVLAPWSGGEAEETLSTAVAAGALASTREIPILLTAHDELSDDTLDYLRQSAITDLVVVGDTQALSPVVEEELAANGFTVNRISADDRYDMSAQIATAGEFTGDGVILVEGGGPALWPSGFVAAAYAGRDAAPILLTEGDTLPASVQGYLESRAESLTDVRCMTGVSSTACGAARDLLAVE